MPSSSPLHSNALCVTLTISQIHSQFLVWPQFQSQLPSHTARLKWCTIPHNSSLCYRPLCALFPSHFPHGRPDGLLKTPNVIHFNVSSWVESPSPGKSFAMYGKSCFGDPLAHHWTDTSFLLPCTLPKLNLSAPYRLFIFFPIILSFVRCSPQPWAWLAHSSVFFSDLRLHLEGWPTLHSHTSLRFRDPHSNLQSGFLNADLTCYLSTRLLLLWSHTLYLSNVYINVSSKQQNSKERSALQTLHGES